jgi:hypothetical protein
VRGGRAQILNLESCGARSRCVVEQQVPRVVRGAAPDNTPEDHRVPFIWWER